MLFMLIEKSMNHLKHQIYIVSNVHFFNRIKQSPKQSVTKKCVHSFHFIFVVFPMWLRCYRKWYSQTFYFQTTKFGSRMRHSRSKRYWHLTSTCKLLWVYERNAHFGKWCSLRLESVLAFKWDATVSLVWTFEPYTSKFTQSVFFSSERTNNPLSEFKLCKQ